MVYGGKKKKENSPMCWLTPPTTDLAVTSDAYIRIFDNLHVCSLKNVCWIKKFEFILVIKKKKSTFAVPQISTSRRLLSDVSIWRRRRLRISLPLPPLQGFPLSLLSGQTAKELPHFPLSLGVSETHDKDNISGFSHKPLLSSYFGLIRNVIPTCSWPRWASLWPGSASPSWSPSERPWTPSCTCAAVAPSLSPLWCCHASFHSPTWQISHKEIREFFNRCRTRTLACFMSRFQSFAYTSTILGVSSFRGMGFFLSNTSRLWATGALLMASRISPWSSCDKTNTVKEKNEKNTRKTLLYSDPLWHPPVIAQVMFGLGDVWKAAFWLGGRCRRRTRGLCRAGSISSPGPGR